MAIVPIFASGNFTWQPNQIKIIEGAILTITTTLFLPTKFRKTSDILLHLQFLLPILPMLVIYGAEDHSRLFIYQTFIAFMIIILVSSSLQIKVIRTLGFNFKTLHMMILFISLTIISSIIFFGGFNYFNLDFSLVYLFRDDAASNLPNFFGYLSPLTSKVLLPTTLLLALINNNKLYAMISIIGSVMIFGLTAHKGPLFYPIIILFIYYISKYKNVVYLLLSGYVTTIIISIIGLLQGGLGIWIGGLLLRRAYFVPSQLNFAYYDFFSNGHFLWWSESKISLGIVDSPYNIDSPHLIGREFFGNILTYSFLGLI